MIRTALLSLLLLAAPAIAADWRTEADSRLGFTATAQGEAFQGVFKRFEARIRFDPAALEDSRFEVEIDLRSVDSRNAERDEMLADPAFFDSLARPQAQYVATRFTALEDGRFRADGELTLRGATRAVPLDFAWASEGDGATLDGEATLDRIAFGIGSGEWEDASAIAHEVRVRTRLVLSTAIDPP